MNKTSFATQPRSGLLRLALFLAGLILLLGLFLVGYRLVTGRGLGLRDKATSVVQLARALTLSSTVKEASQGKYTNIVFLHHSVGNNLIEQGDLHRLFREQGFNLWDQGYNNVGLRGPDGNFTGAGYVVPNDNTDVDGMEVIFTQTPRSLPINTLSGLLQHEVILFKSCFPNNNIGSAERLDELKGMYLKIRATVDQHPDRLFILFTSPPLNPAETSAENAARARAMANWLKSDEYLGGRKNLRVFDFYDQLAEPDGASAEANMLRLSYREGTDSHPNQLANRTIAPEVTRFVMEAIASFRQ